MPSLIDLIQVIPPDVEDQPEDIFAAAVGLIFTDDLRDHHGDPDSTIVYKSSRFGNIELSTADPGVDEERKLFSHYLWNAGIKLAELISQPNNSTWNVTGERVLELGAGEIDILKPRVGLVGIVATIAGAQEVIISDYPADVVLANIRRNAERNIRVDLHGQYLVEGHEWGELTSPFAIKYANSFTRILAADCYWIPSQHQDLVRSMLHFLTLDSEGRIFAVSGFHTGRARLVAFFDVAIDQGLEIEEIFEEDAEGFRRHWMRERDGSAGGPTKKWLVIARLRRRGL